MVKLYRFFFQSSKTGLILLFWLSQTALADTNMIQLFKTNKYNDVIDQYGAKYTKLNYSELVLLSESYKKIEDFDRQIKILKHLNLKKPKYYKIHLALADASKAKVYSAIKAGQEYVIYQAALTDTVDFYRSAIALNPKNIKAYQNLMVIYKDQENVQEGLALTKDMLAKFGERSEIVLNLCEWSSKYGLVSQTQKACKRAAELNIANSKPLIYKALSLRDSGNIEDYKVELFKIYELFPNDEKVIDLVGQVHIENKDYINAERVLEKIKDSKSETLRINLATSYYENEKFKEALSYLATSCAYVNADRRKLVRYFESRLRRLEMSGKEDMAFKFQRELNVCRATPVVLNKDNEIRSSDFSEGIRLPANARNIEGATLSDKRYNYEQSRKKGESYKSNKKENLKPSNQ